MKNTVISPQKATAKPRPSIIERARKEVSIHDPSIQGEKGENDLLWAAGVLVHGYLLSPDDSFNIIMQEFNPRCVPPFSEKDVRRKISEAIKNPLNKSLGFRLGDHEKTQQPDWSPPSKKKEPAITKESATRAAEAVLNGFQCSRGDLIDASPYKLPRLIQEDHFHRQGAMLVEYMFEPDELVNIVTESIYDKTSDRWKPANRGTTLIRAEWTEKLLDPLPPAQGGAWIRMNAVDGNGISKANLTSFRYSLLEFDDKLDRHLQLSVFARLSLPIIAIIDSGRRGYHAWIAMDAVSMDDYDSEYREMFSACKQYGLDSNVSPTTMSRLPGVIRNGRKQELIFLNPDAANGDWMKGILQ
jgi:hypothetical protein